MDTDAYLNIVLPGMSDWHVEPVLSSDGKLIGYQLCRTQIGAMRHPGAGNEHLLDGVREEMEARAKALNEAAEPMVRANYG
jgi:hypothetical protein